MTAVSIEHHTVIPSKPTTTKISYSVPDNKNISDRHLIVTTLKKSNPSTIPKTPPEFVGPNISTSTSLLFDADPFDVIHQHQAGLMTKSPALFPSHQQKPHQMIITNPAEYPLLSASHNYQFSSGPLSAPIIKTPYPTPTPTTPGSPQIFGKMSAPNSALDEYMSDDKRKALSNKLSANAQANVNKERKARSNGDSKKNKAGKNDKSGNEQDGALHGSNSTTNGPAKSALYKTEMCRSWEETGTCRYGNKCQFAHSENEIRPVDRHPKYKTEMCRTFWEKGSCPYGKRCCFIHTDKDLFEKKNGIGSIPANLSAPNVPMSAFSSATSSLNAASTLTSITNPTLAPDSRTSSFPERLPPPHTVMLKDSQSTISISTQPISVGPGQSMMAKSPLSSMPKSAGSVVEGLWRQSPPQLAPSYPPPGQYLATKASPFTRAEDSFKQLGSHAPQSFMGNHADPFANSLDRSFQTMSLNDTVSHHQLTEHSTKSPGYPSYRSFVSPYSRNYSAFPEENTSPLKSFDGANGAHSRVISSSLFHGPGSGMRANGNYYTPQVQSTHRFRTETHNGGLVEEHYWGEPVFGTSAGSSSHPMLTNGHDFASSMSNGGPLSADLYGTSHQRTFSSPAFSLMFDSLDSLPNNMPSSQGFANPHHYHTTSTTALLGAGMRNGNSIGLGR